MKKVIAAILALCLLYSVASAEALRVVDLNQNDCDAYRSVYPDRSVEIIESGWDEQGRSKAQEYLLDNPESWDVARIRTNSNNLAALAKQGLLMDLSDDDMLSQRVAMMYPAIRAVVTQDDQLLAIPTSLYGEVMQLSFASVYQDIDILTQLGISRKEAPHTFEELCALAERYMALPKETRKGTVFNYAAATSNAKQYFLYYLIELYTAQYCDDNGHVNYDTPVFRNALNALETLCAVLETDPKMTYTSDGKVYELLGDASSFLLSEEELLYLGIGDNKNIPASLQLLIVNKNTPNATEALEFLALAATEDETFSAPYLLEQIDYDSLARQSYNDNIEAQKYQQEDQSVIDMLERERDSGEYKRYLSRDSIARYAQQVTPLLTFPCYAYVNAYDISNEYAMGSLSADALIEKLNSIAAAR